MESTLIVYKSKTGFTKRYVEWIAESIACQTVPFDRIDNIDLSKFNIIIYGAGMHAGRVQGLEKFKKKVLILGGKKIVVFATGAAPDTDEIITKIKTDNFSADELDDIKFFYFQSGINYEKMGFLDKTIMKTYSKVLELKNNKSDIETGTGEAISSSYDYSNRESIKPMVDYLKQLINKTSRV